MFALARFAFFDLVYYIHAIGYFSEDCIAPALIRLAAVVEEVIVTDIDEKLRCGGVGHGCSGHGQSTYIVAQSVVCLIFDGSAIVLLLHARLESTALNHEVVNNTMKYSPIVESRFSIFDEIRCRNWCLVEVELYGNCAVVGLNYDHVYYLLVSA